MYLCKHYRRRQWEDNDAGVGARDEGYTEAQQRIGTMVVIAVMLLGNLLFLALWLNHPWNFFLWPGDR